jgi:hypothetical protein
VKEKDKVTIKIPRLLYKKLREQIKDTGFSSVNQFIVHCMRDIASTGRLDRAKNKLTKKEIAILRERLRNLDYL